MASIQSPTPYVDALNHLQVDLLRRRRAGDADAEIHRGIHMSINGVSAGLRNNRCGTILDTLAQGRLLSVALARIKLTNAASLGERPDERPSAALTDNKLLCRTANRAVRAYISPSCAT